MNQPSLNFKPCGDCQVCCQGYLEGTAYGMKFGLTPNGPKPCGFLQKVCTVYSARPSMCSNYYCAWSQGLFPEWMKPNKSKVLVSVQTWSKGQYLLATVIDKEFDQRAIEELTNFTDQNSAPLVLVVGNQVSIKGGDDFKEEYQSKRRIPLA